jgi:hypothetical protein
VTAGLAELLAEEERLEQPEVRHLHARWLPRFERPPVVATTVRPHRDLYPDLRVDMMPS